MYLQEKKNIYKREQMKLSRSDICPNDWGVQVIYQRWEI